MHPSEQLALLGMHTYDALHSRPQRELTFLYQFHEELSLQKMHVFHIGLTVLHALH